MSDKQWFCGGIEFKEGDMVFVTGPYPEDNLTMGDDEWDNSWITDMDQYKGLTFFISHIDETGVFFTNDEVGYGFPLSALENLTIGRLRA